MVAVGFERGGADLPTYSDAVLRHSLVAEEADNASGHDPWKVMQRLRMNQSIDRFVSSDR